jgi:hypothetical protein
MEREMEVVKSDGNAMDRSLLHFSDAWSVLIVPTFALPMGFLVALAYWFVGWTGVANCRTRPGERAAQAVIATAQNWLLVWTIVWGLNFVVAASFLFD